MENQIITVNIPQGVNSLVNDKGQKLEATLYRQKKKDKNEDGNKVSDYNKGLPNTKKFLAPIWDSLKKQWPWGGDDLTFKKIVKELRLRYPDGQKKGELIEPGKVSEHQRDFNDPIFHHPDLISKIFIEAGSGVLNLNIPEEAFLYYTNKELREIHDQTATDDKKANSLLSKTATLVFGNPQRANVAKRKKTETLLDAMNVINKIKHDETKLKYFATILDIPMVSIHSDANELVNALTEHVSEYGARAQKNSGYESLNQALVALGKMDETEIQHRFVLKQAKKYGHIRSAKDGFFLLGQLVEGPKTMQEIYVYFSSEGEKATQQFVNLLEKMRDMAQL